MKKFWIIVFLLAAGLSATLYVRGKSNAKPADAKPAGGQPVAVIIRQAEQRDVPVWLTGIGSVQASNTVTVRPRVSGALDTVSFTEGSLVKAGDVIARIDPRPYESILAQAEAKKVQDEAQLANARVEADRFENLLKDDAVSKQQFDAANANAAQLAALVQADDAAIKAAQLDLDFTTIRAPISGRTGIRLVDAGNIVTANQGNGLVVITEIQPISVIFTLPQQSLAALAAATPSGAPKLKVEALGENAVLLDAGELELIDNQIDVTTGTLKLKARFANEKLNLWPGQFVSARVLVDTLRDSLVVSPESVQPGLDGPFCYVVKADQTVEARPVKTGLRMTDGIVIEEGLKTGEKVVVTGQTKLSPGAKVSPQEPPKAP